MATRKKLPATLAVAALTATLYGCGGGGDNRFVDLEDQLGTVLTAESLKELQDGKKAAEDDRDRAEMNLAAAVKQAEMDVAAAKAQAELDVAAAKAQAELDEAAAVRDAVAAAEAQAAMDVADAVRDAVAAAEAQAEMDVADAVRAAVAAAEAQAEMDVAAAVRDAVAQAERDKDDAVAAAEAQAAMDVADAKAQAERDKDDAVRAAVRNAEAQAEIDKDDAVAAVQKKLDALEKMIAEQMREEEREGRVAMVEAVEKAVDLNRKSPASFPFMMSTTSPKASRDSDGMVTIELSPSTTSVAGGGSFPDGSDAAGDGMWTRVELMRDHSMTNSASIKSDTIVIYTDVEAPMDVELLESEGNTAGGEEFVLITKPILDKDGILTEASKRIQYMELDNPPTTTGGLLYQNGEEFGGMYRNIPGTFRCVGGSCGITKGMNDDGEDVLMFLSGASDNDYNNRLRFIPDDEEATYPDDDMKYAYFGWWLEKGDAGDPEQTVRLQPFHGGVDNAATVDMAMTGTASYTGDARGMYVYVRPYYVVGELEDGQHGLFEATATLTADFGEAGSSGGIISGEVNNFDTGDDDLDSTGWSVTLRGMGMDATAALTDGSNMARGMTDVLFGRFNHEAAGSWGASFHDPGEDSSDAPGTPGTITGIFDAVVNGVGLLTGGFGAKLDMPPAEQ